ncbi:MAG TPA: ABC transporter substrate-binding protein [Firmicutes bacterium]|nr:ABC transporter substrate-binding protein [Bacillota bacterium]
MITCLVSIMVVGLLLSGCGAKSGGEGANQSQEPIKIGVIAPLTGPLQFEGQQQVNGVRMAVDEVNKAGGILGGRMITVVEEDGKGEPTESVSAAEKLIVRDKVVALQGAHMSTATKAVMPVLEKYGVPMVTAISTIPDLTEGNLPGQKYLFRVVPHVGMVCSAFTSFLTNNLNIKKLAMIVRNDDWGRSNVKMYQDEFQKQGGEVVAVEYYTSGETNFLPQLTAIKGKNPDALFLVAQSQDGAMICKQAKEVNFGKPIVGVGAFSSDTFIGLAKDAANGVYGEAEYVDMIDTPANKAFVEAYKSRYPKMPTPDKYAAMPYIATKAIIKAIELAGSTEPAKVRDALEKVSFDGLTGQIAFDQKHQAHPNVYVTVIQNQVAELVETVPTK